MLKKLDSLALLVYLKVTGFFTKLRDEEDGMEIVQVVLIILVGVLAIVGIWLVLGDWLQDLWAKITGAAGDIK